MSKYKWTRDNWPIACAMIPFAPTLPDGSLDELQRKKPDFVPQLTRKGEMARFTLNLVDNQLSNSDIAARLLETYAAEFPDHKAALTYVTGLLTNNDY